MCVCLYVWLCEHVCRHVPVHACAMCAGPSVCRLSVCLCSAGTDIRQERGAQTQTFWVRISSGGVGVFDVKGRGSKSLVYPSKRRETKLFGGMLWDFAGICGGARKV